MPNKVCNHSGCSKVVTVKGTERPYCNDHIGTVLTEQRRKYPRNYYGSNWNAIRSRQLKRFPNCQCLDIACKCSGTHGTNGNVQATEVDHMARFSEWTNKPSAHKWLMSLCKSCHSSKTIRHEVRSSE